MKPRTAAELADYARWGIDPDTVDNYRAKYPDEHRANGYVDAAIRHRRILGPQAKFQDEHSTDGRSIYGEMNGEYKEKFT